MNKQERKKLEEHIKADTKAIEANPNDATAYYNRGNSKAELGDHQGAIDDYTKAIEIDPNYAKAYFNRGVSKDDLEDYQGAIDDYTKAIEIDPNYAKAYFNRGFSKCESGDHQSATEDYTKAIDIDPKYASAYSSRGVSKGKLGGHQSAIEDFTKAIAIDPDHNNAYYNRGNGKAELGDHQGAIEDCTKAIDIDPNDAKAYNNRGVSKGELGNEQGAIDDYTKAIEIDPNDAQSYFNRGFRKNELEDYQGAIDDYTKAIEINPKHAAAYYHRGNIKAKLGDHQGAIDDFFKLTEYTKINPEKEKEKGKEKALYQYMPIDSKKLLSLINKEVYFADYQILNDPFECYFMQNQPINKSLTKEKIIARILSLTHNPKSHIMYSHYAKSHKGICVEYEIDLKKLKDNKKVSYGPVEYQTKNQIESLADLYMLKHEEWAYEKEYRIVRFDGEEFMRCEKIKSITFALKCSEDHKKIIYALTSENTEIKYYQIETPDDSNNIEKGYALDDKKIEKLKVSNDRELFKLMLKHGFDSLYHFFKANKEITSLKQANDH